MRSNPFSSFALSLVALGALAVVTPARAQQMMLASSADVSAAPTSLTPVTSTAADEANTEAMAIAAHLEASPLSFAVHNGVLRVDGFTAKVRMNAHIENAAYLSMFIPGTGTVVISLAPTPGSELVPNAFHGNRLQFTAAGRDFTIISSQPTMNADAYVRLDSSTADLSGQPFISYGAASTFGQPGPIVAGQPVVVDKSAPTPATDLTAPAPAAQQGSAE